MGKAVLPDASGTAPRLYNLNEEIGEKTNVADKPKQATEPAP